MGRDRRSNIYGEIIMERLRLTKEQLEELLIKGLYIGKDDSIVSCSTTSDSTGLVRLNLTIEES